MKHYELMTIFPGTLTEEELAPIVASVEQTATEAGAAKIEKETLGKSRLAYPIKHIRYGYFYFFRFEAEPDQAHNLAQKLRLLSNVLRSLIQIYDPAKQAQAEEQRKKTAAAQLQQMTQTAETEEKEETPAAAAPQEAPVEKVEKKRESVSIEEIDKKLDEILDENITNI